MTIFVPGDGECEGAGEGAEGDPALAIVASNTLRLRIVPCSGAGDSPGHAAAIHRKQTCAWCLTVYRMENTKIGEAKITVLLALYYSKKLKHPSQSGFLMVSLASKRFLQAPEYCTLYSAQYQTSSSCLLVCSRQLRYLQYDTLARPRHHKDAGP